MLKLEVKSRADFSTLHRWLDGADAPFGLRASGLLR
jgi:hypothetical protein